MIPLLCAASRAPAVLNSEIQQFVDCEGPLVDAVLQALASSNSMTISRLTMMFFHS